MCAKRSEGLPVGNSMIYLRADRLVSFSPKGAALSPIAVLDFLEFAWASPAKIRFVYERNCPINI